MDSEGDLEDSMAKLDTFMYGYFKHRLQAGSRSILCFFIRAHEYALEQALAAAVNCIIWLLHVPSVRVFLQLCTKRISIHRPFSVSEVEALVDVVERLGTGRYSSIDTILSL
ncbi:hypothetical protein Tco_1530879 [Tanacetum coccineum]